MERDELQRRLWPLIRTCPEAVEVFDVARHHRISLRSTYMAAICNLHHHCVDWTPDRMRGALDALVRDPALTAEVLAVHDSTCHWPR